MISMPPPRTRLDEIPNGAEAGHRATPDRAETGDRRKADKAVIFNEVSKVYGEVLAP